MTIQRQGDVLVIHGVTIPKWAKQIEGKVVAKGELTGHNHEVKEGVLYEEYGRRLYLHVEVTTVLRHPEHGPLTLEPGQYEIRLQQEYPDSWLYLVD